MKTGTLLLLLALGVLCATLCKAGQRSKGGGSNRGHGKSKDTGRNRSDSNISSKGKQRERKGPVLARSVNQNDVLGTKLRGERYPDCNATLLTLTYEADNLTVSFCNGPYRPKYEDVCKVTDADGTEEDESCHELKTCDEGQECIVGPFKMKTRGGEVTNLYQCGVSADEKPQINCEDMLKKKACASNGDCKDGWSCDLKVTLNKNDVLTICQKNEFAGEDDDGENTELNEEVDEDHILLHVFTHCGKENLRDIDEEGDDAEEDDDKENMNLLPERRSNGHQGGEKIHKGHRGRGHGGGRGHYQGRGGSQVHGRSGQHQFSGFGYYGGGFVGK